MPTRNVAFDSEQETDQEVDLELLPVLRKLSVPIKTAAVTLEAQII